MKHRVERYHDICAGHRVAGHEGKCQHLHGHNYRVFFTCEADDSDIPLDQIGRVIDFSEVKARLCMWLEDNWDHKFLAWEHDHLLQAVFDHADGIGGDADNMVTESIVWVDFNPTAENMAEHLVNVIGPQQLAGTGIKLVHCKVEETRKCSASYGV